MSVSSPSVMWEENTFAFAGQIVVNTAVTMQIPLSQDPGSCSPDPGGVACEGYTQVLPPLLMLSAERSLLTHGSSPLQRQPAFTDLLVWSQYGPSLHK